MSLRNTLSNPAMKSPKEIELNEEWNNFVKKIGEVSGMVKDMASGDKAKADAASKLADQYLQGKVILDEDVTLKVKSDRTVINNKAFKTVENKEGEVDKDAWMAEISRDAEQRYQDKKVRKERAGTLKTQAVKAYNRGEYEKALSCYNRAIEQLKDNPMLYCDRALTNIKLGNFEKVFDDCKWALRLNENSYKARLYQAKAYKELEETAKFEESRAELQEMFPQHEELTKYFLNKKPGYDVEDEEEEEES